jgi:hypothetical protein
MEDALPIRITSSASLLTRYVKLGSIVNKQETQTNFQTLTAGWYEDEANITHITITLLNNDEYAQQFTIDNCGNKTEISDDVTLYVDNTFISCFIAVTTSEIELLDKQPKILSGYISMKVKKVINETAEKLGLLTLPL